MTTPNFSVGDVVIAIKNGRDYISGEPLTHRAHNMWDYNVGCVGRVTRVDHRGIDIDFRIGVPRFGCGPQNFEKYDDSATRTASHKKWARRGA